MINIKSILKKKFKIRIKHVLKGHYEIQYANYRIIPIWISLKYWLGEVYNKKIGSYFEVMLIHGKAIEFSEKFKNIKDIKNYNKSESFKKKEWYRKLIIK